LGRPEWKIYWYSQSDNFVSTTVLIRAKAKVTTTCRAWLRSESVFLPHDERRWGKCRGITARVGIEIIVNCYYEDDPFLREEIPFHERTWRDDFHRCAFFASSASRRVYPDHASGIRESVLKAKMSHHHESSKTSFSHKERDVCDDITGK